MVRVAGVTTAMSGKILKMLVSQAQRVLIGA